MGPPLTNVASGRFVASARASPQLARFARLAASSSAQLISRFSQPCLQAGLAFALKYQNKPNVAIAMYGDGAANQGQLFEALNMAREALMQCIPQTA